ncbi:MAG: pentapeptide repeat-containing protein [Chloroflexi bacterium]|nr:pentapeptide repeat-containing protein [Chloroflexota bacterium]
MAGIVRLERQTIADVDFAITPIDSLAPSGCVLERCDFRGARLDRRMRPLFRAASRNTFRECRFDGVDLRGIDPGTARFEGCAFDGADLSGWSAMTAEFVDCHFAGSIQDVRFYGRPWGPTASAMQPVRAVNEFRGNDFRQAELVRVLFLMGISLSAQRWPADDEYVRLDRIHQRLARGRSEILRWRDLDARNEALAMVRSLSLLYIQQGDVVARRSEPGTATRPEIQTRVWETLAAAL